MTQSSTSRTTLPTAEDLIDLARTHAAACGVDLAELDGDVEGRSPINGAVTSRTTAARPDDVDAAVRAAGEAFLAWREVPGPVRGAVVKRLGELLTEHKDDLAALVSIEAGKVTSEARGEVQEMIDICDYAVGLSRQLFGRTMTSECGSPGSWRASGYAASGTDAAVDCS
ncbi:aldehyde dehydrogenase family protein [Mobilicoccus caccae]|uniref:Aldehyde dehydrogenase domain-containing protein n=1 Tax=Mobilicoccus caccae TaxID=1859295 RepID=A0ABQ6IXF1_9MICO|nr:aldehyde dehydrogenase family protein [Mobilicoccus caccae]GMA41983.1 hypothetical protein GCM10025883_40280 [Mobilicoccus caccae]